MILLTASNIKKMFLDETLFDGVSFNVDSADKIGFIGVNGAGKSTLFKIINGEYDYDGGEIFRSKNLKIGYLEQYACADSSRSIWDEMLTVFDEVIKTEQELDDVRFDIENGSGDLSALISRQTALQERFSELDGFYYKSKVRGVLLGLGFTEEQFKLGTDKLSGGQKTRISLGKILLSDSNLLLLDEPTNHLDIESVEWLEGFLQSYKGAFIVISHDRYFLDRVTNKTFEMEAGRFRSFNGAYSAYAAQREIDKKTEERNYENTMREIERLEGIVEQQRRWNRERNIRTAESKLKVIEKLEKELVKPVSDDEEIRFAFKAVQGGGNDVIITENLGMGFSGKQLFSHADMHIKKGEKVFLLGPNGCGKTTFLKVIMGMYEPTEGSYKIGADIHIGYYDQIQENLSPEKTIFDEIYDDFPNLTPTEIRNSLAAFLFRGEDVFKEIKKLSGGERARVELVKLMLKKTNLLIMDEPTNHLDIDSREALEKALSGYDGTILMVSHDRYFINKTADRVLYLSQSGIRSFNGGYDDYIKALEENRVVEEKKESCGAVDYKEQKRIEAKKRKLVNDLKKTETAIAQTEEEISALTEELNNPALAADYTKLAEISEQIGILNEKLESLYWQWEELQSEENQSE